jgi:hypothetical protein
MSHSDSGAPYKLHQHAIRGRTQFSAVINMVSTCRSDDRVTLPVKMAIAEHLLIERVCRVASRNSVTGWLTKNVTGGQA